jgi:peptidoglycan pentaglycine glycine transferase (the first glycine)
MSLRIDTPADDEWDSFVVGHPQGHVLQLSAWGKLKSEFGWQLARTAVRDHDAIVAGAQVLLRRLPLGYRIAYVPKGPLLDPVHPDSCQALFDALRRQNHARQTIMLKVEPDLLDTDIPWWVENGFRPSGQTIQPRRTLLVDITGTEDEILSRMKSKTRYNIRVAERQGVQVHAGQHGDLGAFDRLMTVTGERDAFGIHSAAYYDRAYALFAPTGQARLFVASCEGQPIAGLMAFACGSRAWYMYGASANEHRDKMPNYALQWAAICWARSRGCHTYDLWGVPDEEEGTLEAHFAERKGGLWGVYRFKRGFGGRLVRTVGAFDYVYNRPAYWLYRCALRIRANQTPA